MRDLDDCFQRPRAGQSLDEIAAPSESEAAADPLHRRQDADQLRGGDAPVAVVGRWIDGARLMKTVEKFTPQRIDVGTRDACTKRQREVGRFGARARENVRGDIAADFQYYNFVDRYDTLGLGADVPLANGTTSDSLLVLRPAGG